MKAITMVDGVPHARQLESPSERIKSILFPDEKKPWTDVRPTPLPDEPKAAIKD